MFSRILFVSIGLVSAFANDDTLSVAEPVLDDTIMFEVDPDIDRSHLMSHYLDPTKEYPSNPQDHELYHRVPKDVRDLIDKHGYDVPKEAMRKVKHKKFKPTRVRMKRRKL